jgi:hypothetical protein
MPFPEWVPEEVFDEAGRLSASEALVILKSSGLDLDA